MSRPPPGVPHAPEAAPTDDVITTPDPIPVDGFAPVALPVVNKTVYPLGLALNYGISPDAARAALDGPQNYIYWTPRTRKMTPVVRDALARDRDRYVLATGPSTGWWAGNITRFVDRTLRLLNTDYIDILLMHWLGKTSALTPATTAALVALRASGKVRAIGTSIHDRPRAGRLAGNSEFDLLMLRYNAAHPGAERDIFPYLPPGRRVVVAYTATRWRKLLKRPRGWQGRVPTAGDCYRFCLSHPNVHVTLTGPKTEQQLQENLAAMKAGPMVGEELEWMREFGRVVHG